MASPRAEVRARAHTAPAWLLGVAFALAWLCAPSPWAAEEPDPERLVLSLDSAVLGPNADVPAGFAFLTGRARTGGIDPSRLDLVFLIDLSGSTAGSSGTDVDGDGDSTGSSRIGRWLGLGTGSDRILDAEVAAVRVLVRKLDFSRSRVGIVTFQSDALVDLPLSRDAVEVEETLDGIGATRPEGATNIMAALQRGAVELLGTRSSQSSRRKNARRVAVLLTDGEPTVPEYRPRRSALKAARLLAKRRIPVHTFAIGAEPAASETLKTIAKMTSGSFTPVLDMRELPALFEQIDLADITSLEVTNLSLARAAEQSEIDEHGRFAALVRVGEGTNSVEVLAKNSAGKQARVITKLGKRKRRLRGWQASARDRLIELQVQSSQRDERERQRELEIEPEK